MHFSVMLDNYLPPLPGYVWLSVCCRDTKLSWAPLASSTLNLDIRLGSSLLVPILFGFGLERVGRQRFVQHDFHGSIAIGRRVEGYCHVALLVQL